ncbi:MAG: TetR/AcrR family transcriptional regulator [Devosiaceae bacterium]|nr:TetR/AcrR family transcriptional regulator [Devosiaceae bacterium]
MKLGQDNSELTERQGQVLEAALNLLVLLGDKWTMTAVAKAASCSKETLYNWFGDREGLLVATVQWQAAKVQMPDVDMNNLGRAALVRSIEQFGRNLLRVLTSETSVALNRVAISRARSSESDLGMIVLQNGRFAMGKRLKPLLEAGQREGILQFLDSETAYRSFFGLLLRDTQIRLLLGDNLTKSSNEIKQQAAIATGQFMQLYGV